jgi:glycosyltransferase involved in cell wall biosynthesis
MPAYLNDRFSDGVDYAVELNCTHAHKGTQIPRIDILIPAFNAAPTIADALGSMQCQSIADLRILVVDDGSTDRTAEILAALAAADPRIEVIRQPNGGVVEALNVGLARCGAEFVARHDADDLAVPDRLALQLAYLDAHPDCLAVSGAARHIDAQGRFLGTVARLEPPDRADPAWIPAMEPYLMHPFLMARRAALQKAGGYRHVVHAEDSDLYWRLQEQGRLHNMDEVLGDYRMHGDSISGGSLRNGRIMAMESQRAALSAKRRRRGAPDLAFLPEAASRIRAAGSLAELMALGRAELDAEEASHLELAVAGKLLELAAYRPYELELEDCLFIGATLARHGHRAGAANRAKLARMLSGSAARLLAQGKLRFAVALAPGAAWPATLARLAVRLALPARLRRALGRAPRQVQVK